MNRVTAGGSSVGICTPSAALPVLSRSEPYRRSVHQAQKYVGHGGERRIEMESVRNISSHQIFIIVSGGFTY